MQGHSEKTLPDSNCIWFVVSIRWLVSGGWCLAVMPT
jgi:hypothetical protein